VRLVLARPSYGPIPTTPANYLLAAVMHAANSGHEWVGAACPDRLGYAAARNMVVKTALMSEDSPDAVVWVDDDVVVPKQAIARLAAYLSQDTCPLGKALDFVSGVYFQRRPPHHPLFGKFDGEAFHWARTWSENSLVLVGGVGFGFCATSLKMLRAVSDLPEVKEAGGPFQYGKYSEDLSFCISAAKAGFPPYVDTGIMCGHEADPLVVTVDTFTKHRDGAEGSFIRVEDAGDKR